MEYHNLYNQFSIHFTLDKCFDGHLYLCNIFFSQTVLLIFFSLPKTLGGNIPAYTLLG